MKPRFKRVKGLVAVLALAMTVMLLVVGSASAATYEKTPGGTTAQIAKACFYIAVNDGANGTGERLYYYFSLDELKAQYGVEDRAFDYTNHTVGTTTNAHGFSITKLLDSLVDVYGSPLNLDETWSIQYLEEDAYHARGSAYIDTIAAAADTTKPMLTFEIKEVYTAPTKYNVNDADYKWAENLYPEYLRVYRQTDSANSSVLKMMMGIAVSPDGAAYNADTAGSYHLTGTDALGNQVVLDSKGKPGRAVLGGLAGMKLGVPSPTVAAYTATAANQVITVQPATTSTQEVAFSYTANEYLAAKNWTTGATTTYTEYDIASDPATVQNPESLAYVQNLLATGDAANVDEASIDATTAEFLITIPTRKLFVDTRVDPTPYGYTDLNLYRYSGNYACLLAGVNVADASNVVATSAAGERTLYTGVAAGRCFVAYKDSHSKACPNNTSEGKRFTWVYNEPKLIDGNNGDVLMASLASIDVNAPIVKAMKITTPAGKRSAKLRKARSIRLRCRTTPGVTIETVTWKSSNPKIAKVNAKGKVTASKKRTGRVTITVTSTFGVKATFKVKVVRK